MSDKKMIPVDADSIQEGDVVKIPFKRRGTALWIGGKFALQLPPHGTTLSGITVDESDIVRAPATREVVNVPCEVLRDDDYPQRGDIVEFTDSVRPHVIDDGWDVPLMQAQIANLARVLRPIKKP